jgi:copper homeostasis protein
MPKLLEVIVTSAEEAREAELGGADRLELVRDLHVGGLTPRLDVAEHVVRAVSIPVRVMVRENASMWLAHAGEIDTLRSRARQFRELPIDGLVLGFVKDDALDAETIAQVADAAPGCRVTLHRAFEHAKDPLAAIQQAKQFPQIDRILTGGGAGNWQERKSRLLAWQTAAAPEIGILIGIGLRTSTLTEMALNANGFEFHAGRAARVPHTTAGVVSRNEIARLKARL